MNRLAYIVAATVVVAFLAIPAYAGGNDSSVHGPGMRILALVAELGLTDEQKTDAANIIKENRDSMRSKVDALIKARLKFATVSHQDEFNEEAVRTAYKEVAQAGEEVQVARAELISELRAQLTAEQKEILGSKKAEFIQRAGMFVEFARKWVDLWVERHASS